jgi:hypothetical protein
MSTKCEVFVTAGTLDTGYCWFYRYLVWPFPWQMKKKYFRQSVLDRSRATLCPVLYLEVCYSGGIFHLENILLHLILVRLSVFWKQINLPLDAQFLFLDYLFHFFFLLFSLSCKESIYPESLRNHAFKLTNCWVLQNWRKLIISLYFRLYPFQ